MSVGCGLPWMLTLLILQAHTSTGMLGRQQSSSSLFLWKVDMCVRLAVVGKTDCRAVSPEFASRFWLVTTFEALRWTMRELRYMHVHAYSVAPLQILSKY